MPSINVSLSTLLIIPIVILDPSGEIAATVLSALFHELGHLSVIRLCGIGIKTIRVTPYGLEIEARRKYRSFFEEIAVNCSGCAVNFMFFMLFHGKGVFLENIAASSLILGILNALPIISLDGGEALRALLSLGTSFRVAEKTSYAISFITLTLVWSLAAYIFFFTGYNYSLFIMSLWLFGRIYCKRKQ